uniref:Bacterial surface antigen (D15) domain-containing protein n=1 Tax=Ditylenchus dipsaci TaxID=166011 RepID=A0A915EEN3_9BILA
MMAEVVRANAEQSNCVVEDVQFHVTSKSGKLNTKVDALVKEISELYNSNNLDELVKNSHLCARHMKHVGLFEECTPFITTSHKGLNSYTVDFIVQEPRPLKGGVKLEMTMAGNPCGSLLLGKESVFGRGESADLSFTKTMAGHNFNFTAAKPFLGWQRYSNVVGSAFRTLDNVPWNSSHLTENGFALRYNGQILSKKLMHSLCFYFGWRRFDPLANAPIQVREHAGHTTKISFENTLSRDTRDRPILASSGAFFKWSQEYAGLLGDSAFVKHQFDVQAAAPLFFGAFIGGPHDVRGFDLNSLGTRAGTCSLGGASSLAAAFHVYRPLVPANMLYAMVLSQLECLLGSRKEFVQDMAENPRISAGIGLTFVYMNALRLELNYVHPLRYVPGDVFSASEFSSEWASTSYDWKAVPK